MLSSSALRETLKENVYHQRGLTTIAVDKLWEASFLDIHVKNEVSLIPLEIHCFVLAGILDSIRARLLLSFRTY